MRGIPVKHYKFYLKDEEGNAFCDLITVKAYMEKESIVDCISHYVFCIMRRKLLPEKDWGEAVYKSTLYRAGVKDTWKTVKSLYKLSSDDIKSIFGEELWVEDILNLYDYDTVKDKLNQHAEERVRQDTISRKAVLERRTIKIKKGDIVRFKETSVFCRKHPNIYECASDEWTVGWYTLIKLSGFRGGVRTDQLEIVDRTDKCSPEVIKAINTLREFCAEVVCDYCPIKHCEGDIVCNWEIKEEFERKFENEQV